MGLNKKTVDDINVKGHQSSLQMRLQRTVKRWQNHR